MAKFTFTCRQCREKLTVPEDAIGKTGKCFNCGTPMVIPTRAQEAEYHEGLRAYRDRQAQEALARENEARAERALQEEEGRRRLEADRERDGQQTLEIIRAARSHEEPMLVVPSAEEQAAYREREAEERRQQAAARWRSARRREEEDPWPAEAMMAYVSAWVVLVLGIVAAIVIWNDFRSLTIPPPLNKWLSEAEMNWVGIITGFVTLLAYTVIASLLFCAGKAVRLLARRQTR